MLHPISLLVGEMPGRAEGGEPQTHQNYGETEENTAAFPHRPAEP